MVKAPKHTALVQGGSLRGRAPPVFFLLLLLLLTVVVVLRSFIRCCSWIVGALFYSKSFFCRPQGSDPTLLPCYPATLWPWNMFGFVVHLFRRRSCKALPRLNGGKTLVFQGWNIENGPRFNLEVQGWHFFNNSTFLNLESFKILPTFQKYWKLKSWKRVTLPTLARPDWRAQILSKQASALSTFHKSSKLKSWNVIFDSPVHPKILKRSGVDTSAVE